MPSIAIQDEAQWLELRKNFVGASEIAALFDISTYQTRFQLWHEKAGNVEPSYFETEEQSWGKRLEQAIAEGIAERHGLIVEKCPDYFTHPTINGMGATPDFLIRNYEDSPGILEIKNVSYFAWRNKWFNDAGEIEPPLDYELQVQSQLACTGYTHACFGVLVGGQDSYKIDVVRHDKAIRMIEQAVESFWDSIRRGDEPEPFNESDYTTALALFERYRKPQKDFTGHAQLPALCSDFLSAKERKNTATSEYKKVKTQILSILRGAENALCDPYTLKFSSNKLNVTNNMEE